MEAIATSRSPAEMEAIAANKAVAAVKEATAVAGLASVADDNVARKLAIAVPSPHSPLLG